MILHNQEGDIDAYVLLYMSMELNIGTYNFYKISM